jgi:hypothetical protein
MQFILKILLVPAFWIIFLLVLQFKHPKMYNAIEAIFKIQKINFTSDQKIKRNFLESLLPANRNIFYWLFFQQKILGNYLKDPIFLKVNLHRCTWSSFNCYNFEVVARLPAYVHVNANQRWLVDDQGVFIRKIASSFKELPEVNLAADLKLAPQVQQARHRLAYKLIKLFKNPSFIPQKLVFLDSGDINIKFRNHDFSLILSPNITHKLSLDEQVERFYKVAQDLGPALAAVKQIDLGFDLQAVVTPKEQDF